MANTVSAKIRLELKLLELLDTGLRRGAVPTEIIEDLNLTNGTVDGKINLGYYTQASSIAASTTTVVDLVGSVTDAEGSTIDFAEVVCILLINRRETALAWIEVGPDATNGFGARSSNLGFWAHASDRNQVDPYGGIFFAYSKSGVPVAAGSTDELAITTSAVSGDTNTWDLIILGRSA